MAYPDEQSRSAHVTASNVAFDDIVINPYGSGITSRLIVPRSLQPAAPTVLVLVAMGTGDNSSLLMHSRFAPTRDGMVERGWIMMSTDTHNNESWGNDTSLADFRRCFDWASDNFDITCVLLHGLSMGGITVADLALKHMIPTMAGWVSIDGALSFDQFFQAGNPDKTGLYNAYGATDEASFLIKSEGHDPCKVPATLFTGQRAFIEDAVNDTVIDNAINSTRFIQRMQGIMDITFFDGGGGHVSTQNFAADKVLPWCDASVVAYTKPTMRIWHNGHWSANMSRWIPGVGWQSLNT